MHRELRRKLLLSLLSLVGTSGAILLGMEIFLRVQDRGYGFMPLDSDPYLHHVHPRSYRFTVTSPGGLYGDFKARFGSDGAVTAPEGPDEPVSPDAEHRVAFMGDSFVEALHVPFARSFIGRLQAGAPRTWLRNYGVSSYSPILYRVQWERQVAPADPTHVFLMLYSNDVRNDREYARRAVRDPDGIPVRVDGGTRNWFIEQGRRSYALRLLKKLHLQITWRWSERQRDTERIVGGLVEENPSISDDTSRYVLDLAHEVQAAGAELVLTVVPSKYRVVNGERPAEPEFSERWESWAADHGIPFVDLVDPFHEAARAGRAPFLETDVHFSEDGHALVAAVLRERYPDLLRSR